MIKNIAVPIGMVSLFRIGMLIEISSIKIDQAVLIIRKMRGNPVQDHSYPVLMKLIDQVHEVLGRAISGGGCKISHCLVAPGTIKWMFHHRQKFNMGESHLLHVLNQVR